MTQRSTKGASKQRRDAINDRISQLRELLPTSEAVRCRLSQLQVMAMTNAFITKSNFFADYCFDVDDRSTTLSEHFDFTQSLPGFLLIASVDGRILYISENVSEYLGNSAVDTLTQMETIYDVIDDRDRDVLRQAMMRHHHQQQQQQPLMSSLAGDEPWLQDIHGPVANQLDTTADELTFTCRMNSAARCVRNVAAPSMTKTIFERQKIMQVTGRFVKPRSMYYGARMSQSPSLTTVFVAYCTPHLSTNGSAARVSSGDVTGTGDVDTMTFRSLHFLDMKYAKIESNGEFHLECDRRSVFGKSWYETIHWEDVEEAQRKHMELTDLYQIGDMTSSRSLCMRVQTASGRFVWLHVVMSIHGNQEHGDAFNDVTTEEQPMIMCVNHVIDETAALYLRVQELEIQTSGVDETYHQLMSTMVGGAGAQTFSDLQFPVFGPNPVHNYVSFEPTPSGTVDDKQELRQRLKRKIRDQQHHHQQQQQQESSGSNDVFRRSKVSRLENISVSEASGTTMSLCSMPSPPIHHLDHQMMAANSSFGQSQFDSSMFGCSGPDGVLRQADSLFNPMNGFVGHQDASHHIPDSFLTPSNSPVSSMERSPASVSAEMFDFDDLVSRLPEERSFFCGNHSDNQITATAGRRQEKAADVQNGAGSWGQPLVQLPELDHRCVASILGDVEPLTPSAATMGPSMLAFGTRNESTSRQRMSGGHVIVVSGQSGEYTQCASHELAMAKHHRRPQVYCDDVMSRALPTMITGTVDGLRGDVVVDELFNDTLIHDLLALGGDFLQNLTLGVGEMDCLHAVGGLGANQFRGIATSIYWLVISVARVSFI